MFKLVLYVQAIVDAETQSVAGYETVIRATQGFYYDQPKSLSPEDVKEGTAYVSLLS
ncbi:hypothetical protein [Alicyclobacillus mengziensis]|uniref:Uncharacterized protein n=1 Tax=Alicyclobacillus mengziensis TaxID=2931921 RepID=A0A9X7W4B7_9BACL|nr:hypothetical protein [Alicyclobacillus mengziensis]QSO50097.1 hypothetical protein JZ786_24590 [Alicyclobacillus mengziensis]